MIPMNNYATEAVKKLSDGKKNITGNKEKAMAGAVHDALKDFCLQDPEFAQAVVQGGNFADCMKAVTSSKWRRLIRSSERNSGTPQNAWERNLWRQQKRGRQHER